MAYLPAGGYGGISGIQGRMLEVNVVGCQNLSDKEWFSRQDPYVCIEYGTNKFRTRTDTDGGKNPSFNEKFMVSLIEGLREINAYVFNSNTLSYDDYIGTTRVLLERALSSGYDDTAWPLKSRSGKYAGELRLILHYSGGGQSKPGKVPGAHGHAAPMPVGYPGQYPPQPVYAPAPGYPPQQAPPVGYAPQQGYPPAEYAAPGASTHGGYPPAGYPPAAPYAVPAPVPVPVPVQYPVVPGYIPPAPSHIPHAPAHPHGYPVHGAVPYVVAGAAAVGAYGMYSHGKYGHHKHKHGKFKGKHQMWGKHKHGKHKWK